MLVIARRLLDFVSYTRFDYISKPISSANADEAASQQLLGAFPESVGTDEISQMNHR